MIRVPAPAKINLYLHVVGRRDDGYHRLDSLVAFAATGDIIDIAPAQSLSLAVEGPMAGAVPAGPDNIVMKAARRLALAAGVRSGASIRLEKHLPVASGIGGGSADAAATLKGLARLWGLAPPAADLALAIGADVPVCLAGVPSHMGGIGEILTPAPALPPTWLVLANPMVALATPAVFKARSGPFSAPAPLASSPADAASLAGELALRRNDLTAPACALAPAIGTVLHELERLPGCLLARMSGSGATCFALFASEAEARNGAARLTGSKPAWWVAAAALESA